MAEDVVTEVEVAEVEVPVEAEVGLAADVVDVPIVDEALTIAVDDPDYKTLKLLAEELKVSKRKVEDGGLRLERKTTTHLEPVDLELRRTSAAVERIAIDQPVDSIPTIRTEGDVVIVPVVEEKVEVIRRLILKEEVHIRLDESTERYHDEVELRKQDVEVSHITSEARTTERFLANG